MTVKRSDQCPASAPWAVMASGAGNGIVVSCHATQTEAVMEANQMSAAMGHETRTVRTSVEMPADGRTFEAKVMSYGIVDDYDTVFDAGCFTRSLEARMPRLTWGHDWTDLIGRVVDYKDTEDTLTIVGELDDFEAVPRARQAYAQLRSGTLDNFSVGFRRTETRDNDDRTHFVHATLDEVALVLSGAVPGTETLAVRSKLMFVRNGLSVPEKTVIDLARLVAAGTLTKEEAGIALDLAAGEPDLPLPGEPGVTGADSPGSAPDIEVADALESLGFG